MSTLEVRNSEGQAAGTVEIQDDLLVLDKGEQAVHEVVVATMAAQRAGTASTLSKGQVAGSNRKPWRQKGTGRARAGFRQSPIWRGGAVAFGPHPRSYRKKLPRKVARLAFCRALSEKIAAGRITVVEELAVPDGKTKNFVGLLRALDVAAPALVLLPGPDQSVERAARNVPGIEVAQAGSVTTYQVLRYPLILAGKAAMDILTNRLASRTGSRS
jgi:large subunit ribosomal protein L4